MKDFLSLVKFSHTIFAMPFAMVGFFMALKLNGLSFEFKTIGLIIICMITARNAAMAFNRYLDRDIDLLNPRTVQREIPAGVISSKSALIFVIINALVFSISCYFLNPLCFYLSPVALLVILAYSYTKRFTYLCHLVLGIGLALAPLGAYLAVVPSFDLLPILYGIAVMFWVSGFDMIYALQDDEFDQNNRLYSIPSSFGRLTAMRLSTLFHALSFVSLSIISYLLYIKDALGPLHVLALIIFGAILVYQHRLVKPDDLSKVNLAFFTTNGIGSLIYGALVIVDLYI